MTADSLAAPKPTRQAWIVLAVLWFVYVLNFLDRQLVSILAKPIQESLGITDGELGLLSGLYFALFYCIISIPVGWLADRTNRARVLSLSCAVWSAATMGCGLAGNFGQLTAARMLVGIGEAGGVPPSYAIISDYFPPSRRGTALGIFNLGPPIGQAMGVAFGAAIAVAFSWRHAFLTIGAIGIVAALVVFFVVREPPRGGLDYKPASEPAPAKASFLATFRMFFSRPILVLIAIGGGATQFITYGLGNFTVLFLQREKGMALNDVAIWYALVVGIAMSAGIFISGRMIDRFTRKSKVAYAILPAVSLALAVPFYAGFVWAETWPVALLFLIGPTFLNYFYLSSSVTLVQQEVKPNERVMSGALLLLIMNLTGLGFGPTYVGIMSDMFKATHPGHSLQMALYTLIPVYLIAIGCFVVLARMLRREDKARA
ncbi:MAG TPA: MFS transporter [Hyphomonadaceae bacterium]|nr:MFS transporter [Hyphomonadaceae bacterium]HPN06452.1 MFS transporter [Hyphomonadaceae bacterium]